MFTEETRTKAREVFEMWFPLYSGGLDQDLKEKLFDYFHSGYMAGTRHGKVMKDRNPSKPDLAIDDASRNLDL